MKNFQNLILNFIMTYNKSYIKKDKNKNRKMEWDKRVEDTYPASDAVAKY